ncbi:hypothetical protein BKA69DRAFT_1126631 [Paraphysoderma sedebokerense]|nr:hypothetical protein BKA69DRAFT_1126631 [Paraphysoderma sedebokerense]
MSYNTTYNFIIWFACFVVVDLVLLFLHHRKLSKQSYSDTRRNGFASFWIEGGRLSGGPIFILPIVMVIYKTLLVSLKSRRAKWARSRFRPPSSVDESSNHTLGRNNQGWLRNFTIHSSRVQISQNQIQPEAQRHPISAATRVASPTTNTATSIGNDTTYHSASHTANQTIATPSTTPSSTESQCTSNEISLAISDTSSMSSNEQSLHLQPRSQSLNSLSMPSPALLLKTRGFVISNACRFQNWDEDDVLPSYEHAPAYTETRRSRTLEE